ncbi:MAG: hypothetical protein MPW15_27895 [Candidatus Manganitrophus sp.]|nr:hypothetical protein [Candidatus Manganitrophus sp.]
MFDDERSCRIDDAGSGWKGMLLNAAPSPTINSASFQVLSLHIHLRAAVFTCSVTASVGTNVRRNRSRWSKTIHQLGGVAVLAHPYPPLLPQIVPMKGTIDGIELWNTKYNGRLAPALWNYQLLKDVRKLRPEVLGFYGTDFHWKTQYAGLAVWIEAEALTPASLLAALRNGKFYAEKEGNAPYLGRLPHLRSEVFLRKKGAVLSALENDGGRREGPFKALRLPIPQRLKAMARKVL